MNTTKHTPGPWHLTESFEIHNAKAERDNNGARIGNTPNRIAAVDYYPEWQGYSREANAQLIAAAPEMLEALEHALVALDNVNRMHNTEYNLKPVRDAIAKAKGEA